MRNKICLVLLLMVSYSANALANQVGIDSLQHFFKNTTSFAARFEQVVLDESQFEIDRSEGEVWVKRPGKFRWDYVPPNEQQIISDGKTIWVYDVELEQVTVQSQEAILGRTPAAILSGGEDIEKNFELIEIGNQGRYDWVNLVPKDSESSFTEIRIGFEKKQLRLMELLDTLGQRTRIIFVDLQENESIDNSKFNFSIPEGVDVIDGVE